MFGRASNLVEMLEHLLFWEVPDPYSYLSPHPNLNTEDQPHQGPVAISYILAADSRVLGRYSCVLVKTQLKALARLIKQSLNLKVPRLDGGNVEPPFHL